MTTTSPARRASLGPERSRLNRMRSNGRRARFFGSPCFNGWVASALLYLAIAGLAALLVATPAATCALVVLWVGATALTWRTQRRQWLAWRTEFCARVEP